MPLAATAGLLWALVSAPVNAAAAESWHEVKLPGEFFTVVTCVFRRCQPLIPVDASHRFQLMPATHSS